MATLGDNFLRVINLGGGTGGSGSWSVNVLPNEDRVYTDATSGTSFTVPLPILEQLGTTNTNIQVETGLGVDGGDIINFTVDGINVGSVEILGGIAKWNIDGILDPIVYAGTARTIAQRNALTAVKGYLVYISDGAIEEYQYYNGTIWKTVGAETIIINDLVTGGTTDALSAEQGKVLETGKVNKPVTSTQGFIATVNATGDDVEYIAASPTASPNSQLEVTNGTVVANKYVQPDTLKVELDKKLDDTQLIDDDTFTSALATNIPSAESTKAYVDGKTVINNTLTSTSTTESLSANQGKVLQDTKEIKLVSTGFATTGSENTLGINTTDTLQTIANKLNLYVANVPKVLKSVALANSTNLVALQTLEPTITLDDFLFEWDTDGTLSYTVIPLDKFIDSGAYVSHAFKGAIGTANQNIVVFTQLDASTEELDLSRFANSSFLEKDLTQTANRIQNFGTFSQTWDNVGAFTKNYPDSTDTQNFSSLSTPNTSQIQSNTTGHNVTVNDGAGITAKVKVTTSESKLELDNNGLTAAFELKNGVVGTALGVPQTHIKTVNVDAATAVAGQILTLTNATTGEVEFQTGSGQTFANADLTATANRTHSFADKNLTITQTTGDFSIITNASSGKITSFTHDIDNSGLTVNNSVTGIVASVAVAGTSVLSTQNTITGDLAQVELSSTGANLVFQGTSDLKINSSAGSAYQVLSSQGSGTAPEWRTIDPTVQTLNITGNVTAWNSTVVSSSASAITITLPQGFSDKIGKTVTIKNNGVGTITVAPFSGNSLTGQTSILTNTAVTYTLTGTSTINTTSSIDTSSTSQSLTYGRVNASANLASIAYSITSPGTAINFNATQYSSGTTFSGTNGIIPSVSGRYRANWLAMAGSAEFNGDGTFHIVQNGVSLGNVFINMMEAAGVNQVTPQIDVDLVAGLAVTVNYQPSIADSVPWDKGSYFQLSQLPIFASTVVDTVAEYGAFNLTSAVSVQGTAISAATATTIYSFTIPTAGTWNINTITRGGIPSGANSNMVCGVFNNSNVLIAGSDVIIGLTTTDSVQHTGTGSFFITTLGSETFTLKGWNTFAFGGTIGGTTNGSTGARWTKIAGQLSQTGSTVDYVTINSAGLNVALPAALSDLIMPTPTVVGNIPYNTSTGVYSLTAGKTYELRAFLALNNAIGWCEYSFVDATANTLLTGTRLGANGTLTYVNNESSSIAGGYYTPSVNQNIKVRVIQNTASGTLNWNYRSWISITQIGSTSNTVGTLPAVDHSAGGYFDIGNMRMQWGTHNDGNVDTTTVTLPASFANNTYAITATSNTSAGSLCTEAKTTTTFDIDRASTTVTTQEYSWFAIGSKP
jgi:hypothetical protein